MIENDKNLNKFVETGKVISRKYKLKYETRMYQPAKLSISLHEIQFERSDVLEMEENENFVPKPILRGESSFEVDLEIYEFKYGFIFMSSLRCKYNY